ncbi:hypothetical protein CMUS01_02385 [Colletotrichum musicola]|uniref:Uncharacterized protein n=1 Tax=Colletotrichum musicola TaxID=2175873 RepID=A0A8H6NVA5_9PEZI|nr:hypothetical protein CMUS01_02385 [Colletotrichum musicola]
MSGRVMGGSLLRKQKPDVLEAPLDSLDGQSTAWQNLWMPDVHDVFVEARLCAALGFPGSPVDSRKVNPWPGSSRLALHVAFYQSQAQIEAFSGASCRGA